MAHGTPDFWGASPKATTYGLQDMAELAVRMGSVVSFDRRGDVILYDDFTGGTCKVEVTGSGTGNEIYPTLGWGLYRDIALMLKTGSGAGDASGFSRDIYFPVLGNIGLETAFCPQPNMSRFEIWLRVFTGTQEIRFKVYYKHTDGKIYLQHCDGLYYVIGTPGVQKQGGITYCTFKLVGNILTSKYVRVLFNSHTYLVSDYAPYVLSDTTAKSLRAYIITFNNTAGAIEVPVGYYIITQNEPA